MARGPKPGGAEPRTGRDGRQRHAQGVDARLRAMQALLRIELGEAGTQGALREALDVDPALQGADRGLAAELVYGVQRRRRPLDAWLARAREGGLYGLELPVLVALRVGAYQLAFQRVPAFAAVHTTVEAAKTLVPERAVGLVHAMLRQLDRLQQAGEQPGGDDLPPWIRDRLLHFAQEIGRDPQALLEAFCGPAPLHLHAVGGAAPELAAELAAEGVPLQPIGVEIPGVWATEGAALFASPAFAARRVLAQDAGSAAVVEWLGAGPGDRVADIAAGRGVKSLCLAARGARVTAVDVGAAKLEDAAALCLTAGHPLAGTRVADAAQAIDLPAGAFDAVLVDAPCTGLGTLRRRPEVRHRRQAADLVRMAALQQRILANAAALCRPGGTLLFATCSFAPEEGPLLIEAFLRDHPAFAREPGPAAWVRPLLDSRGDLRSHPLLDGMDAFYGARLVRKT